MNTLEIQDLISRKTNHLIGTKLQKYANSLPKEMSQEDSDRLISKFVTDISFDVSNRVIQDKICKINPKPLDFDIELEFSDYFESSLNDLMNNLPDGVYINDEVVRENTTKIREEKTNLVISFSGYCMKDGGYIGTKQIQNSKEFIDTWCNLVLSSLYTDDPKSNTLEYIKYGFNSAILSTHVIIEEKPFTKTLINSNKITSKGKNLKFEELIELMGDNRI